MDAGMIMAWLLLTVGVALSFLYSGIETGAYVLNKIRLDLRAESGSRSARRLLRALADPGRLLGTVLIGNNLSNYMASAGMVLLMAGRPHAEWWAMAVLTPITLVFCEMLPKNLFRRYGETLTYQLSGMLAASARVFTYSGLLPAMRWAVAGMMKLSHRVLEPHQTPLAAGGRLSAILAEGQASGVLTHAQSVMADRVVNIPNVLVSNVMVKLDQAVLVPQSAGLEDIRQLLQQYNYTRYGVYSGQRANIVGVLNIYDALLDQTGSSPASFMTPPLFVSEILPVTAALLELQHNHQLMGFAIDAAGRCTGLVTVKDLVEEVVGELEEL